MATKFPKFSQDLAQDPTRRIWYGDSYGRDFESHDGMTEALPKIFATTSVMWQSSVDLQPPVPRRLAGNFQQWIKDPLNIRPIAHAIWDPHFGKPAVDFTQAGASYPVNIAYSGVYHWWYTIGMRTNNDLYMGAVFLLLLAALFLFAVGCTYSNSVQA